MSGALLLAVVTLVCAADLLIALRFSRLADRADSNVGAAPRRTGSDPAAMRRFARIMFVAAPLMWLFFVALTFGLLGPVGNITPITF
jgi:hypothetical protein